MESQGKMTTSLFDVYLRLRPPNGQSTNQFLTVERESNGEAAGVTIHPPHDDYRRRAIEKYSFTKVFEEDATQRDVFEGAQVYRMIQGALGTQEKLGKDGLLATLGVTGSGKTHTILGTKAQRGLTQMLLDVLFRSLSSNLLETGTIVGEIAATEITEAQVITGKELLESIYGEVDSCVSSRAQTPLFVSTKIPHPAHASSFWTSYKSMLGIRSIESPLRSVLGRDGQIPTIRPVTGIARMTKSRTKTLHPALQETPPTVIYPSLPKSFSATSSKNILPRLSSLPQEPSLHKTLLDVDQTSEYAILVSMYEVYNNRICDLLHGLSPISGKKVFKEIWKPALLFKNTELSPEKKVVAGLRKIICGSLEEALLVLESGLSERSVAETGSNATSSRSHGFLCVEIKKRRKGAMNSWTSTTLTVADLAGSERARTANTFGTTLAEAGKINQSLMLLGQVMQASTGIGGILTDPSLSKLAIRQCKLTEILFSNAFCASTSSQHSRAPQQQKAIMMVTADPRGDYNATSQILKYSALAKETTIPRIPSVTSTILASNNTNMAAAPSYSANTSASRQASATHHRNSAVPITSTATVPPMPYDLTRLNSELDLLREQLAASEAARFELTASWSSAEERLATLEAEVREECWSSFEARLEIERARWANAWAEEREQSEGHVDRKVEVVVRGIGAMQMEQEEEEDGTGDETTVDGERERKTEESKAHAIEIQHLRDTVDELERENETLRAKAVAMERERAVTRTPSRKVKVLKARPWSVDEVENLSP